MDKIDVILKSLISVLVCIIVGFLIVLGIHLIGEFFPVGMIVIFGLEIGYLFKHFYDYFKDKGDYYE